MYWLELRAKLEVISGSVWLAILQMGIADLLQTSTWQKVGEDCARAEKYNLTI